jgi:hypothetical protein
MSPFTAEAGGLITCSLASLSEKEVYAAFQAEYGEAVSNMTDDAKILFKVFAAPRTLCRPAPWRPMLAHAAAHVAAAVPQVSIDDNTPLKQGQKRPVVYAGLAHTAKLSALLDLFNKKFCKGANQEGAPHARCSGWVAHSFLKARPLHSTKEGPLGQKGRKKNSATLCPTPGPYLERALAAGSCSCPAGVGLTAI